MKATKKRTSRKRATPPPRRWFMDMDEDCNHYLVPEERRAMWKQWVESSWYEGKGNEAPEFVIRIDDPLTVTFTDPQGGGHDLPW